MLFLYIVLYIIKEKNLTENNRKSKKLVFGIVEGTKKEVGHT